MPAQQISPSAARRSPLILGDFGRFAERVGDFLACCLWGRRPSALGLSAESMRMTPYLRTPCLLRILAMRQAFSTASTNFLRASASPIAESPTVPGHTGATSEPTAKPFAAILSAIARIASSLASGSVCGWNRNRSTPSNFWPFTVGGGRQLQHPIQADRRVVGAGLFADEAGPHGVVKFRECMRWHVERFRDMKRISTNRTSLELPWRLFAIIADLWQILMHIRAEVAQAHERFAAGVFDFHAAQWRLRA